MKNVYTAQSPAEAHLVAGLLDEAGIECVVEGELLTGARMGLPMDSSTLPSVSVRDEDVPRAMTVIEEHRGRVAEVPPTLPDDELPERPSLTLFKHGLLAMMILSLIATVIFIVQDPIVRPLILGVACVAIVVWLMAQRRRTSR